MSELWWISFADEDGHKGVVVLPRLPGENILGVIQRCNDQGINPGGEVAAAYTLADKWIDSGEAWALRKDMQNRLITSEELMTMGYVPREWNP